MDSLEKKPHVVCIPFPAQGHINPMLKLAKLLHSKGFHITFVHTEFNHQRLLKSRGPDSLAGLPSFRFETIPDGLPPSDLNATQDVPSLCESTSKKCLAPFKTLLSKLNDTSSSNVPPVSCIVSDGVMTFTLDAAQELGIPDVLFWTTSACGFLAYAHYHTLIQEGFFPLKDVNYLTNGYLERVVDCIPGMKGIRLKDIPTFIRTTNPNDFMVNFVVSETRRAKNASTIILNTFEELEFDVLNVLSSIYPPIYSIGPLNIFTNQIDDNNWNMIGSNLWKEEPECLEWLDSKEPNSVVYVNFGSITVMTPEQLVEFSWGLANSKQTFLWIIRPDLVSGDSAILPTEFMELTKERSFLAGWCPQEKVLGHPAVGGFLTHGGWNSTLESISSGVPMIFWPFFGEQQINCWYSCNQWAIGMEIDNNVKRDEVERLVRELMMEEKGKEMRKKILDWKRKAEEAITSKSAIQSVDYPDMRCDVPELKGDNYKVWKERVLLHLGWLDLDYAIRKNEPPSITETSLPDAVDLYEKWDRSNRLCVSFIKTKISAGIRGSVEHIKKVQELLKAVDDQFATSDKAMASTLIMEFTSLRLDSIKGVRDHIMRMRDIAAQLKALEVEMSEVFLVHYALSTLPHQYGPFKISYNTHKDKWTINELMTMCVQEEGRLLMEAKEKESVNFTTVGKNKKNGQAKDKGKGKIPSNKDIKKEPVCFFCKRKGHIKKECSKFKNWLDKKGIAKPAETSGK